MNSIKITTPRHLSKKSKEIFRSIIREFEIDDPAGIQILISGLEARDRYVKCRKEIDKDGESYLDRFGQRKSNPLLSAERDSRGQWLASLKQLNLDIIPNKPNPGRPPIYEEQL